MTQAAEIQYLKDHGLYSADNEHDACGVGFVAHIRGEKSHSIVKNALKMNTGYVDLLCECTANNDRKTTRKYR